RRRHGRTRAAALRLPVCANRLRGQPRELRRPAQLVPQRSPRTPARHPDHAFRGLSRGRTARRAQSPRGFVSLALPGQGGGPARRADHRPVQRRRDPWPRRVARAAQPDLRAPGRAASGDAQGGERAADPGADAAQPQGDPPQRGRLAARARRARPNPAPRTARGRGDPRARDALRTAGMLRRRARGFPELPYSGPRASRGRRRARGGGAPGAPGRAHQLRRRKGAALASGPTAHDFFAATQAAVRDAELRRKLENASGRHLEHVAETRAEFPAYDAERAAARLIKEDAIARLDELLARLKERLEANGCRVFVAADAAEARKYIVGLAGERNVRRVVKGKSMATEEIELNAALAEAGCDVVETDLGEYIVQLRGERPSHIITPAIHLSKEDIGALFHDKLHIPYTAEPEVLTAAARARLRETFLAAEMGVTGVNFAIAESGTLVLVENEGNGRMSSTLPEIFVAVMGIEKVIPAMADLSHFLEVLARTATGQKLTTYTNFISGPRRAGEADGPREVHVVMLDNGRSRMLADPVLREALYCLRCGA